MFFWGIFFDFKKAYLIGKVFAFKQKKLRGDYV